MPEGRVLGFVAVFVRYCFLRIRLGGIIAVEINRAAIKANAKIVMSKTKPSPILVAFIYILLVLILGALSSAVYDGAYQLYREVLYRGSMSDSEIFRLISYYAPTATQVAIMLALWLMSTMLNVGFYIYSLAVSRLSGASVGTLFDGFAVLPRALAVMLLSSLFTFLWCLLGIIPAVIGMMWVSAFEIIGSIAISVISVVISIRYSQAIYVMLDNPEMSPLKCIRESKRLMVGRTGEYFVLEMSFFGWILLSIIPILYMWVMPYMQITLANYYNALLVLDRGRIDDQTGKWNDYNPGRVRTPDDDGH